jgi:hypothetical protein
MSLRDFNSSSEDRPIILNNESLSHEAGGNGAGLGSFHTVNPEDREPNNTPKIIGALAVALMVGAAGAYVYSVSGKSMQPAAVQTASNIPAPAPLPPAPQPAADTTAPAPAADATPVSAPAPAPAPEVKSASTKPVITKRTASNNLGASSARMAADTTQPVTAPRQTAAIPEPVSPTPSPSDVAINTPNGASAPVDVAAGAPAPANGTAAADQQATVIPQTDAHVPAPEQAPAVAPTPAQPAPAQ